MTESDYIALATLCVDNDLVIIAAARSPTGGWRLKLGTQAGIRDSGLGDFKTLPDCYEAMRREWEGCRLIIQDVLPHIQDDETSTGAGAVTTVYSNCGNNNHKRL